VSFTNMTGYVGIAERMPMEKLPVFMKRYFETQGEAIQARKGVLDKYIGDVIEAFWTEPKVHAQLACECALDQLAAMRDFHAWASSNGYPSPDIRIGVNSGLMSVGELGTEVLRNFTVMGDEVNLASRIEGLTKIFGAQILLSGATRKGLSSDMVVRHIDRVRVKGKEGSVDIFELVCRKADLAEQKAAFLALYEQGMSEYLRGNFSAASKFFEQTKALIPADGPSKVMVERCMQYRQLPD